MLICTQITCTAHLANSAFLSTYNWQVFKDPLYTGTAASSSNTSRITDDAFTCYNYVYKPASNVHRIDLYKTFTAHLSNSYVHFCEFSQIQLSPIWTPTSYGRLTTPSVQSHFHKTSKQLLMMSFTWSNWKGNFLRPQISLHHLLFFDLQLKSYKAFANRLRVAGQNGRLALNWNYS